MSEQQQPIAAITFNAQPVQEGLRALGHRLIRDNDIVTRAFNADTGQSDKCSVVEFRRDQIIPMR